MNFYYIFLLLLVVLSAYSESSQGEPPDPLDCTLAAVCPNSSSDPLGVLAPVLPQSWVLGPFLSQNMVLPQNEVPQSWVFESVLPQGWVFESVLPQNEVFGSVLQNGVFNFALPQNGVFEVILNKTVFMPQNETFNNVTVNCQLSDRVKNAVNSLSNIAEKSMEFLISTLIHGAEKLAWTIRILLECLQHILKMYTWSLSENRASLQFKCRLIGLMLKRSFFRKHDFAACVHQIYHDYQNWSFWQLKKYSNDSHSHIKEECSDTSPGCHFYGGGKALIFSSDELHTYASTDLNEKQYQFRQYVKKDNKQSLHLNDDDVLCSVPLNILAPKLTLKAAKEIASLHDMYMPSKILLKNAQLLLENHKCETCPDLLAVFEPYRVASNAERQKTWYEKNIEKRAEYEKHRYPTSGYRESNKNSSKKYYWSKKDMEFPPLPPSTKLCQNIVADFCADTSPGVFEEAGCAVCGKLTPICKMEELAEVENINLLKTDGVTRKARCKSSDPVSELRGPILAPDCDRVCPLCVESLEKNKVPTLALANGLWVGKIPDELRDLTYAEQLLIARVRHNRCIVKVSSGMSKMHANAISFSNPMPKIYNVLPPPIEEMDDVLAFIYTGPCKPTKADFR